MTDVATTSPRREATRQKLRDAAAQTFAEVGLDAASVEAICERAGFTRGAFYSNYETKEDLFLDLAGEVARERVGMVRERVAVLQREGALAEVAGRALEVVGQIVDTSNEDRAGVLLMSEIRIHALRSPELAAAYLAQEDEMVAGVAQIIAEIADGDALRFRLEPEHAARMLITTWESASVRAVMAGADQDELCRRSNEEVARVAQLLLEAGPTV